MQKQYDQGIDLWAIGCILEELIHCSEPYVKNLTKSQIERHVSKRISFPGTSCFPLSPCRNKIIKPKKFFVEESDQLILINRKINIGDEDCSFITKNDARIYQKRVSFPNVKSFKDRYPHTDKNLIGILECLFEFNPFFRPTAQEILQNPIFDKLRVNALEDAMVAPYKIQDISSFDKFYDYDSNRLKGISEKDLRPKLFAATHY